MVPGSILGVEKSGPIPRGTMPVGLIWESEGPLEV